MWRSATVPSSPGSGTRSPEAVSMVSDSASDLVSLTLELVVKGGALSVR